MSKKFFGFFIIGMVSLMVFSSISHAKQNEAMSDQTYQEYLDFFEKVYTTIEENYYKPVSREAYNRFIEKFKTKIYSQLAVLNKSDNFVRWRSAAFLVDALKDKEDIFSAFYPPEPAKEYEGSSLAKTIEVKERIDLGIKGEKIDQGFLVSFLEPRSDSYIKGLRVNDLILRIDGGDILPFTTEEVMTLLNHRVDSKATLDFVSAETRQPQSIEVEPKEFFKQMVFPVPTKYQGIYALRIERFNEATGEDLFRYLNFFRSLGNMEGLIIDLRDNPGGPPLAARQISALFLPTGQELAYFQKKDQPKAMFDVPAILQEHRYDGPLVILINKKSGSASELFAGFLQRAGRAVLMGENSAGQVMLKSMFHFDDQSMVLLVTARGHHADGTVFSFEGLVPDRKVSSEENADLIDYAQKYFIYMKNIPPSAANQ